MAIHPASIKNTFLRHFAFWCLFLPFLSLIFMPLFKVDMNIDPAEIKMIIDAGVDVDEVSATVNRWFSNAFIKTGIMPGVEDLLASKDNKHRDGFVGVASNYAGQWARGTFMLIYRVMWRVNALFSVYVAALIGICVPALVDGIVVRARKRYQFENYNPVFFYFSYHAAVLVVGLLIYLPLVPIPLTPPILAGFLACLGVAMWYAAANMQTGS